MSKKLINTVEAIVFDKNTKKSDWMYFVNLAQKCNILEKAELDKNNKVVWILLKGRKSDVIRYYINTLIHLRGDKEEFKRLIHIARI